MITLITGASSSGKSEIAETIAVNQRFDGELYYIATMHTWDKEAELKVKRHQEMRADKGFITIEKYVDLINININHHSTCLIECMSNLLANEMYDDNGSKDNAHIKIIDDIKYLNTIANNIVIVTNEIFSDGIKYDEWCTDYINKLGYINCELAKFADTVIESVAGIPVYHKGERYAYI